MKTDKILNQLPTCQQCGICCRYGSSIHASHADLTRWIRDQRSDILGFFEAYCLEGGYINCQELSLSQIIPQVLWTDMINRDTDDYYVDCPFLRPLEENTWSCMIHETRPAICVRFRPWEWGVKGHFFSCPLVERPLKFELLIRHVDI
ncbi:MAG TPA: hypothetical protein VN372_06640 [Methanospirillum sp.]|nr:hypothetical protein [Methanospirillum sp.]